MSSLIQQQENKFIKGEKEKMPNMPHKEELAMRIAYSNGASLFRIIGQQEGDSRRKKAIIDALGLVEEENPD